MHVPEDVQVLRIGDRLIPVDNELAEYLRRESAERGVQVADIYHEEMEARRELERINPSAEEWIAMSLGSGAPEYMKDDPGDPCPF